MTLGNVRQLGAQKLQLILHRCARATMASCTASRALARSVAEDRSTPHDVRFGSRGAASEFFGNPCGVPGKAFVADCGLPKPTGSGRVASRLGDSEQFLRLSSVV